MLPASRIPTTTFPAINKLRITFCHHGFLKRKTASCTYHCLLVNDLRLVSITLLQPSTDSSDCISRPPASLEHFNMLLNTQMLTLATVFSTLVSSRPLDASRPRDIVPRSRSYAIINVDGGTSTEQSSQTTTVVKETKTIEVVNPGPTITQKITSVVVQPAPVPTRTGSSSKATSSSTRSASSISVLTSTSTQKPTISNSASSSVLEPIETLKPIFVTVTVSADSGSTEYYDDGMWHTLYPIKTLEAAVATSTLSTSSAQSSTAPTSTFLPVLETPKPSCNQTTV